jgi:Ca-activated chloride channel homolog
MTFIWYYLLWLLLLIPVLVWIYIIIQRRRKKYAVRFSNMGLVKEAMGRGPGKRRHIPAILLLIAIAVGLAALARPAAEIVLPSGKGTVILVMDVSGSMRADDIKPSRLDASKAAARTFVERQPADVRIGVVAFSETAEVVQTPTVEHSDIIASINRLVPHRGTGIGIGIQKAMSTIFETSGKAPQLSTADLFNSSNPQESIATKTSTNYNYAAIVLLSDGVSNYGISPLEALTSATDNGVKIYTIGLGTEQGTVLRTNEFAMRVKLDETTLKSIANRTGGQYFNASSELDLQQIYGKLGTQLVFKPQLTELTAFFTGFAVLLLIVSAVLSMLWFNRVF